MADSKIHTFPGVYDEKKLRNNFATGIVTPILVVNRVATPVITPPTGTYLGAITVFITCSTPGATIFYTTDGNTPNIASNVYTGSFSVSTDTVVKAFATLDGWINSSIAEADYSVVAPVIQVTPPILDFGTISFLSTANAAFTVRNVGNAPLIGAGNIFGNNAFFITSGTNYSLAPGASQPFNVEFAPSTGGSTFVGFGTWTGGTGATGILIGHTSIPAPIIQVTPTFLSFGTQATTSGTFAKDLTVTNIGDATLVGYPTISGTDVYFSTGSGYTLGPGSSQVDTVHYAPSSFHHNASTIAVFSGGGGQNVPIFAESTVPCPGWATFTPNPQFRFVSGPHFNSTSRGGFFQGANYDLNVTSLITNSSDEDFYDGTAVGIYTGDAVNGELLSTVSFNPNISDGATSARTMVIQDGHVAFDQTFATTDATKSYPFFLSAGSNSVIQVVVKIVDGQFNSHIIDMNGTFSCV